MAHNNIINKLLMLGKILFLNLKLFLYIKTINIIKSSSTFYCVIVDINIM